MSNNVGHARQFILYTVGSIYTYIQLISFSSMRRRRSLCRWWISVRFLFSWCIHIHCII